MIGPCLKQSGRSRLRDIRLARFRVHRDLKRRIFVTTADVVRFQAQTSCLRPSTNTLSLVLRPK